MTIQTEIKQPDQKSAETFICFKQNVDSWIKEFNGRVNEIESMTEHIEEYQGNTNHNYELILEMRERIDDVKEQIQTIKLTQLMIIKKVFAEELSLEGKNKNFLKQFLDDTDQSFQ